MRKKTIARKKSNRKTTNPVTDLESYISNGALAEEAITPFDTPVSVHVHSIRKREVDSDGISAKSAIDGLVYAGLLQDDSPKFVKEVSYSQEKGKVEETYLIIEERDESLWQQFLDWIRSKI